MVALLQVIAEQYHTLVREQVILQIQDCYAGLLHHKLDYPLEPLVPKFVIGKVYLLLQVLQSFIHHLFVNLISVCIYSQQNFEFFVPGLKRQLRVGFS